MQGLHIEAVACYFHGVSLAEIEAEIAALSRAEKAQVLQWVVNNLGEAFPGIEAADGVGGGEPRVVRTRIPVWLLVQARRLGTSGADLLRGYPTLRAEDLANAWAYHRAHAGEIERHAILLVNVDSYVVHGSSFRFPSQYPSAELLSCYLIPFFLFYFFTFPMFGWMPQMVP
ncbi:MAG TPA: DUF433 domain-containing protein [Chthoniobacteraceae bacterium]|nr:DUF433 domain-containing protein [Chthoniobacteraceae bacterium]